MSSAITSIFQKYELLVRISLYALEMHMSRYIFINTHLQFVFLCVNMYERDVKSIMKYDTKQIGLRIRTSRNQKGMNQTQLANALGKSLRTIQKYESCEIEVSIAMIN